MGRLSSTLLSMPYRIELTGARPDTYDRLIDLGALDIEVADHGVAAIIPDTIHRSTLKKTLGVRTMKISPARGRDDESVWILSPRAVRIGPIELIPANAPASDHAVRLADTDAFGTGLHPTTALCVETLAAELSVSDVDRMLDVGTGSGILALAALRLGVPRVTAIDVDDRALAAAKENARLNGFVPRLDLRRGGPESIDGAWPLVLANILAAPLIDMAPALSQRVAHDGRLILSGIPSSMSDEITHVYRRMGMHHLRTESREGWAAAIMRSAW